MNNFHTAWALRLRILNHASSTQGYGINLLRLVRRLERIMHEQRPTT